MKRVEELDWLRGFMAFIIMIYHYLSWEVGTFTSESVIGRLGIYGVSTFYIISGLSMALVYNSKVYTMDEIYVFFIKRFFRILPLMWVATTYELLRNNISSFSISKILMNYTAIFGFINPGSYIMTGGWSIGNEMVFYSLFPIFIFAYNKSLRIGNILTLSTFLGEVFFVKYILLSSDALGNQWDQYINPYNQLFLFAAGIFLYFNFVDFRLRKIGFYGISLISIVVFCFYPINGDLINVVTGSNRFILSFSCIILVFAFFKSSFKIKNSTIHNQLNNLGMTSYSIYLLHPIIYNQLKILFLFLQIESIFFTILISVALTFALSLIVYKYYEEPFIKLGKKFLNKY